MGPRELKLKGLLKIGRWPGGGLKEPKVGLWDPLWWPERTTEGGGGGGGLQWWCAGEVHEKQVTRSNKLSTLSNLLKITKNTTSKTSSKMIII